MRPLVISLFVLACTPSTGRAPEPSAPASAPVAAPEAVPEAAPPEAAPPETADANQPRMIEPEMGHAGLVEMLGSAGACRDADREKPIRVFAWENGDDAVYAAECESFAYQSNFEWWTGSPAGMVRATATGGGNLNMLGFPSYNPTSGHAEWLEKARGPGDCGDWYRYKRDGSTFSLVEHRSRACDDSGATPPPASEWPLVNDK